MKISRARAQWLGLNLLLAIAVIFAAMGFVDDLENTRQYGGSDLRNRVVGARLLLSGEDPYRFKWAEGMPETLLDPSDSPASPVTLVTATPTLLTMQAPLSGITYRLQRIGWLAGQWALLLGSLALLSSVAGSGTKAKAVWIADLFLIAATPFWHLHVERGQVIIFFAFILSAAFWLAQKRFPRSHLACGALLGLAAAVRPPVLFILIPILVFKKWDVVKGAIAGMAAGIILSLPLGGITAWRSYSASANTWSDIFLGRIELHYNMYPNRVIEGMGNLALKAKIPSVDSSLQAFAWKELDIGLPSGVLAVLLGVFLAAAAICLYMLRSRKPGFNVLFLTGVMLFLASEYFIPARRHSYYDVIWVLPLSLVIINSRSLTALIRNPLTVMLVAAIALILHPWQPWGLPLTEVAMMAYLAGASLTLLKKDVQARTGI